MSEGYRIPARIRWRIKAMKELIDQDPTYIDSEKWQKIKDHIEEVYKAAVSLHPEMTNKIDLSQADFICSRGN